MSNTQTHTTPTLATLLLLLLAAASPAPRTDALRRLQAAEQERQSSLDERSKAAGRLVQTRAEAARLAEQRIRAAADLRQVEERVAADAQRLQAATDQSAQADAELARRQADMAKLLPIMMRLAHFPSETILAVPLPPDQALEGLLITRGLAAQLAQEASALRGKRAEAVRLRQAVAAEDARFAAERTVQASKAGALARQIASNREDMSEAERAAKMADERAAALAAQADTLRGAIEAMDASRARSAEAARADARLAQKHHELAEAEAAQATAASLARPLPALGKPHATMLAPVAGPILRAWGSPAEDGPATGVTFGAAPGAFVSSPCAGRIAFAAPFRSYGRLLIIECLGGSGDVVLAGLERLDAPVGRDVRAGEPVGRMPDYHPGKTRDRPGLYMELRSAGLGQPQDPVPFLKARG